MILSREEYKRIQYYGFYSHFNQRLQERYKISVTVEEYALLYYKTASKETIQRFSPKRRSVIVFIKDIPVLVIRNTREKALTTALPMVNKFKKSKTK